MTRTMFFLGVSRTLGSSVRHPERTMDERLGVLSEASLLLSLQVIQYSKIESSVQRAAKQQRRKTPTTLQQPPPP